VEVVLLAPDFTQGQMDGSEVIFRVFSMSEKYRKALKTPDA
jgi:hypothetical protein